jgi:hypothetical protein
MSRMFNVTMVSDGFSPRFMRTTALKDILVFKETLNYPS